MLATRLNGRKKADEVLRRWREVIALDASLATADRQLARAAG